MMVIYLRCLLMALFAFMAMANYDGGNDNADGYEPDYDVDKGSGFGVDTSRVGKAVISSPEQVAWWTELPQTDQSRLTALFDDAWWASLPLQDRAAFGHLAHSLFEFMREGSIGFAPLMLRTSYHGSGTYHKPSGTGGSNGGTIFHRDEISTEQNKCIETATNELTSLLHGNNVAMADAVVVAGVVALDAMKFPRMDLIKVQGGRVDLPHVAYRNRLTNADEDPMEAFVRRYDFKISEIVALVGGAHNFGRAKGKCSGYVGQWTDNPLSWFGADGSMPTFFKDLMKDDWRWYEVCTFENNTVSYKTVSNPMDTSANQEREEMSYEDSDLYGVDSRVETDVCLQSQSAQPLSCKVQAMRGCDFADGTYGISESPCDANLLRMRLQSDFFLRTNPSMAPYANAFANDPDLLAAEFGAAYRKITHFGIERCGLSGHGCGSDGAVCNTPGGDPFGSKCSVNYEALGLGNVDCDVEPDVTATILMLIVLVVVLVVLLMTCIILFKVHLQGMMSEAEKLKDQEQPRSEGAPFLRE